MIFFKQPLKIKSTDVVVKKIEDIFDRNASEHVSSLKKLFEEAKFMSIEVVNLQLNKFREVNQMGKFHEIESKSSNSTGEPLLLGVLFEGALTHHHLLSFII